MSPHDLPEPTKAELERIKKCLVRYVTLREGFHGTNGGVILEHTAALTDLLDACLTPTIIAGITMGLDTLISEAKA